MNLSGIELDLDRGHLNPVERAFVDGCTSESIGDICVSVDVLRERHAWASGETFAIAGSRVEADGVVLRVGNCAFSAELNLDRRTVSFHRNDSGDGSIRLTLRAIATSFLPRTGWIPLHAAAVDTGGSALVFCGRSGAGKSTLASTSPFPLLSDEMVAIHSRPPLARATSFWGDSVCKAPVSSAGVPLRAVVILEKSRSFSIERVPATDAMRAMVATTLTPAASTLWPTVLDLLAKCVETLEIYRMSWWRETPPWEQLAAEGLCGLCTPSFRLSERPRSLHQDNEMAGES